MNIESILLLADTWGMHGDDVGTGWMIVMAVLMMLFWVAVILGIVWVARGSLSGWHRGHRETPTEILDRRFAEGAVPVDDYHQRREIIAGGAGRGKGEAGGDEDQADPKAER